MGRGRFVGDADGFEGFGEGLGFEDHAFASAKGTVVDGAVTVVGEVAEVVGADFYEAGGDGALDDSVLEDAGEEAGEDGDDVESHGCAR